MVASFECDPAGGGYTAPPGLSTPACVCGASPVAATQAVLGLVAGVLAGAGATGIGWALGHFVFKLPYVPSVLPLGVGALAGVLVVTLAGWVGTRHLLAQPPLVSLRALN